jgi:hypothetical protein
MSLPTDADIELKQLGDRLKPDPIHGVRGSGAAIRDSHRHCAASPLARRAGV